MTPGGNLGGMDALIARILLAKPNLTPDLLRLIVPRLDHLDDHALGQKIAYLKQRGPLGKRRA